MYDAIASDNNNNNSLRSLKFSGCEWLRYIQYANGCFYRAPVSRGSYATNIMAKYLYSFFFPSGGETTNCLCRELGSAG